MSDDFVKARLDAAEQEGIITAQMRSQLEMKRELLQAQQQATAQSQIELDEEKRKTEELRQQKIESLKDDLKTTTEKISNLDDRDVFPRQLEKPVRMLLVLCRQLQNRLVKVHDLCLRCIFVCKRRYFI